MDIIKTADALKSALAKANSDSTLGFVPTMGALHQGHLILLENAKRTSDIVVVSIFVNPTQFDNPDDLNAYPKSIERDLKSIKEQTPNAIVFIPSEKEIYQGEAPRAEHFNFGSLVETMEGKFRAGHFNGVGTVLKKFFELVKPDKAFFGEKDYQQLLIARKLVEITGHNISVIGVPIVREKNGLALSSRNERLSAEKRKKAGILFEILQETKRDFLKIPLKELKKKAKKKLAEHPDFKLEYFEIANAKNLEEAFEIDPDKKYRAFLAVYVENVRLIDNLALN